MTGPTRFEVPTVDDALRNAGRLLAEAETALTNPDRAEAARAIAETWLRVADTQLEREQTVG